MSFGFWYGVGFLRSPRFVPGGTPAPAPSFSLIGTPDAATIGTAYSFTPTVSGGTAPYAYAITSGTLPDGLTLNASTGEISGTPS